MKSFFLSASLSFVSGTLCVLAQFPPGFSKVVVTNGILNPTAMAFAPDGRIFVAQQDGAIRIIKNGILLSTPFHKIAVHSSGERGLVGMVLDPNFSSNQYIYVYYTLKDGTRNRVSRFKGNGDTVVPGSEVLILNLDPLSSAANHNGGAMHFKNGLLYIAVGDNAKGSHAQNLDTYHGKLLRIKPDGSIPPGNPFTSGSEQRKRVWSYGLRNPFTFDVQPGTGKIFVNDVGLNAWEEINDATSGGRNFGWPNVEGYSSGNNYSNPVYSYPHGTGDGKGCAITGGIFFSPSKTNYPVQYVGKYFFQDFCNKWINTLTLSSPVARQPFANGLGGGALSIAVGLDGNLYYLERSTGSLIKIIYSDNSAPAILKQPASLSVIQGQPATFSVTASGSPTLRYQWQKNQVGISGATSPTYTIASVKASDAAAYRVIVSNNAGVITSNTARLTVTPYNATPVAEIVSPVAGTYYRGGEVIGFSGNARDAEDGILPSGAFTWLVHFHHGTHYHDGPPVASGSRSGSFTIPNEGEVAHNVWYRLYLVVTDSKGLKDTVQRDIYPRKSNLGFITQPAGLRITLDGLQKITPLTITGVEGIKRSIGVVSPQSLGGKNYKFVRWKHGGSQSQIITTPDDDIVYTAVFEEITPLRSPDNPQNVVSGLLYTYHHGSWNLLPNFDGIPIVKSGSVSNITLAPRQREDFYGFRFKGYVDVLTDGEYTFYLKSDDGSNLFIGTSRLINNDGAHNVREVAGKIGLRRGKHAFTLNFFERSGTATLSLAYEGPGIAKKIIPSSAFYRSNSTATGSTVFESLISEDAGGTPEGIVLYPNPARDWITVEFAGNAGETFQINLLDMNAKVISTTGLMTSDGNIVSQRIILEEVPRGIYLVKVMSRRSVVTKKIIVH